MTTCPSCGTPSARWRSPDGAPALPCVVHVAGPVIACREYRRSCPGYIVDRRQTCIDCGRELCRGRWAAFFLECALVLEIAVGARSPVLTYLRCEGDHPRCGQQEAPTRRSLPVRAS